MYQLKLLPSTVVCPDKKPPRTRHKQLICDEGGEPITTLAGRYGPYSYNESSEEAEMLKALRKEYRGQTVLSRPDIATDGQRVRFEIHLEEPRAAMPELAPKAAPDEPKMTTAGLFE